MSSSKSSTGDQFLNAVTSLSDAFKAAVDLSPTPISRFRARYPVFLERANKGEAQVISQGSKRYLLLSEEQVISLAERGIKPRNLGDILRGVETPSVPIAVKSMLSTGARVAQFSLPKGDVEN